MKKIFLFAAYILIGVGLFTSCNKSANSVSKSDLKTFKDSVSYAYGYLTGIQVKQTGSVDINSDVFAGAFTQGYDENSSSVLTEQQCMEIMDAYSNQLRQGMQNDILQKAQPYIDAAEKFLKENANKDGVKTTASGLQYKVIKQGKGVKPLANHGDRIRFRYALSVLNPDGSIKKVQSDFDKPDSAPHLQGIDNFIAGFTEAVQMMNAGSRYTVWIKSDLGYGLQDSPEIPAGSLLVFDIEVTDVLQGD